MNALIGIALAAYKPDLDFFEAQLQSIVDQTFTDWFCIIGFDSPIEEIQKSAQLKRFFSDKRFKFIQNSATKGVVGNFQATGQACLARNPRYIAYCDQDDVWYPEKLQVLSIAIAKRPAMSVVHCDMHILKKQTDGTFTNMEQTAWQIERRGVNNVRPTDFFVRNVVAGAGMLFDADLARAYPQIPDEVYGQDHWYALVASYFGGVYPVVKPLYSYRIHGENISGITPYTGFFSMNSMAEGLFEKCMLAFNSSRARYRMAALTDLPTTRLQSLVASSYLDLGFGYFFKSLMCLTNDPALARACFARAAGKIFRLVGRRFKDKTRH